MGLTARQSRQAPEDLLVDAARAAALKAEAMKLASLTLSERQLCDLELLLCGACSPLKGYMTRADLADIATAPPVEAAETQMPRPFTLDVDTSRAETLVVGQRIVLRDDEGAMLAILEVDDIWRQETACTESSAGRAVNRAQEDTRDTVSIGGRVEGIGLPAHHDYPDLRPSPQKLWSEIAERGLRGVILVDPESQLGPSMHRAVSAIALEIDALVLLQVNVGAIQPTELDFHRRIKQYRALLGQYPEGRARLALIPLLPRSSDDNRIAWKARVYGNYGVTHLVVDASAYGFGTGSEGAAALSRTAARLLTGETPQLISTFELRNPSDPTLESTRRHVAAPACQDKRQPTGSTDSEEPPLDRIGATCFFTGLSGAGKSTLARAVASRLTQLGRRVSLLDGDLIRKHLSSELTFSKEHRDLNIRRIGYVASEITRHGGIAICAPIAPYAITRAAVRAMVEEVGGFLEIHVSTPLAICEHRDPKGLYAKAHAGLIKDFTGVNDPYEAPENPELAIDTAEVSVQAAVDRILAELHRRGCLNGLEPPLPAVIGS